MTLGISETVLPHMVPIAGGMRPQRSTAGDEHVSLTRDHVRKKMAYEIDVYFDAKMTAQKTEPLTAEDAARMEAHRRWITETYHQKEGSPVPEEYLPRAVRFSKGKKLFDYQLIAGGRAVSQRFKDLVESIEPGVHQFTPVEVYHKDGTIYGTLFYFVICSLIDAINPATSGVEKQWHVPEAKRAASPDAWRWKLADGRLGNPPAVFAERTVGRAAWHDSRMPIREFYSDALVKGMESAGMQGFHVTRHWLEL